MKIEWKDHKTHYKLEFPDSSTLRLEKFRLSVHRHIHYPKKTWLASCNDLFSRYELKSEKLSEAKVQAKEKLKLILSENLKELNEME